MTPIHLVPVAESPLGSLSWVDLTACAILLVFFVLGLFRGFVWQLSRIVTILLGIHLSGQFAVDLEPKIRGWFSAGIDERVPYYAAYFAIFLGVLIVLGLAAWVIERLLKKTGLSFYDRVGGGVLGVGTGAAVVLVMLIVVFTFFPSGGTIVKAAHESKSLEWSKKALEVTKGIMPERWIPGGVRRDFGLPELAMSQTDSRPTVLPKGK